MKSMAIRWAVLVLLLGLLVRTLIAWDLRAEPAIQWADIWGAFIIGGYQDLLALALLSGPVALALLINVKIGRITLLLLIAVTLIATFAELFFWWEFESRLNRLVFHYLRFPRELVTFLEEQFYLSLFAIPAFAIVFGTYRFVVSGCPPVLSRRSRWLMAATVFTSAATLVLVESWDFSTSRRINQMASNGYLGLSRVASTDEALWHGFYWSPEHPPAAPVSDTPRPSVSMPLALQHVVLIVEESFAGEVWTQPELRARYLPRFSELMAESVYFDQIYATGSRTTRGLEALLNGYPPLPGIALTQREGFERLPALPRALGRAGFHNMFVYGGWPGFSNLFAYLRAIGFHELTSRNNFQGPNHETSWGVADEFLFAKVRSEMTRLTKLHDRVFLTTLTVSHHRPFDFPAGRIPYPAEQRRSEYALAYADWALGDFLQQSRTDDWFKDTLFVVVADHGPSIRSDAPIPIEGYRIPLLFYSPGNLEPRRVGHLGSSMSLAVTLLEMLGLPNDEGLYGGDLLRVEDGLVPVEHAYHVGLLTRGGLTALHRGGSVTGWRYQGDRLVPGEADGEIAARASQLFGDAHDGFYRATDPATTER
ncbi:MAG: LTA synthase family protein [Pseudomonadales bacterium]